MAIFNLFSKRQKQIRAERKQTEEKLAVFQRFVELSGAGVGWADMEGKVRFINATLCNMFGEKEPKDVYGKSVLDYYPEQEQRKLTEEVFPTVQKEGLWNGELTIVSVKATIVETTNSIFILKDKNGNPLYYANVLLDITDRKRAQAEIQASNQQLLANEKEREKLFKVLKNKNDELQSIVYIASHDLKSPLVNINGFSAQLNESCEELTDILKDISVSDEVMQRILPLIDKDIPESLKFISASTSKMKMLLDGLLQVSRIGTQQIDIKSLDMNTLIKKITDTFAFQITDNDVSLKIENIPDCKGDASQINQIFSNLIDNALKYLDKERKGEIKISAEACNGECIYCIEDNGIGIHPTHQGKVFELFHRLNPEDSTEGQGLGLTITKRALRRNNGRIRLESEPGKGSKFFVSLPNA